jgi:hypothetical protein
MKRNWLSVLSVLLCLLFVGGMTMATVADAAPGGGPKSENNANRCSDGVDNDQDTLIDCADPDCAAFCAPAEICDNAVDDDGDTLVDCDDPDCSADVNCPEICDNTVDDDADGLIDCDDPECFQSPLCQTPEICDNGIDDDGDTLVDCDDSDCLGDPACPTGTEICDNLLDEDGDGLIDCDDPECSSDPSCAGAPGGFKHDYVVPMNYELGMHCTGFDFSYCCVLPPYNSIIAQVIKTEKTRPTAQGVTRPVLVHSDPADHTVAVDPDTGAQFKLLYWHEDQRTRSELAVVPAGDCPGCDPTTACDDPTNASDPSCNADTGHILNSRAEGEKLLYWSAYYDIPENPNPADPTDPAQIVASGDNFANAIFRHLYIYQDAEGTIPGGTTDDTLQLNFGIEIPIAVDTGPAGHPLSSTFNADGTVLQAAHLTYTGNTGTVVYTDSPVTPFDGAVAPDDVQIDNVPIVLTNPGIWEALGLALTPFPDGIDVFSPDLSESSIRPYQRMTAQIVDMSDNAILNSDGKPQIFFGSAPIDIPNCERCHSNDRGNDRVDLGGARSVTTANGLESIPALVADEYDYWRNTVGLSDWYARVKSAAISILGIHDAKHGTGFLASYDSTSAVQTSFFSRLGRQTVICHDCHADNVIGVLESRKVGEIPLADRGANYAALWTGNEDHLIPALTEAVHGEHLVHTPMLDGQGRSGSCQGCHPAHRSDGSLNAYPITTDGLNPFGPEGGNPTGDNRDAAGGCYVGRDVHSNRMKDDPSVIGAANITPSYLTAVGQWLLDNVANDSPQWKGIWCTNCHSQVQREMYKADDLGTNGGTAYNPDPADTVRDATSLADLASQLNAAGITPPPVTGEATFSQTLLEEMLDPGTHRANDYTALAWDPGRTTGNIASVSVNQTIANGADSDGEYQVYIVGLDPNNVPANDLTGMPAPPDSGLVSYDVADDARDYWLSVGAPKCADCHQAPFVEDEGGVPLPFALQLGLVTEDALKTTDSGAFPINQPKKYSNNRYTKGHAGLTCQGCHESIHGLYPVTPPNYFAGGSRAIDETSWRQAALLNQDNSHGPVKCGSCHNTNQNGTVASTKNIEYNGTKIDSDLDTAIKWMHTYRAATPRTEGTCLRCHTDRKWQRGGNITAQCSDLQRHLDLGRVDLEHAEAASEELGIDPCNFQ